MAVTSSSNEFYKRFDKQLDNYRIYHLIFIYFYYLLFTYRSFFTLLSIKNSFKFGTLIQIFKCIYIYKIMYIYLKLLNILVENRLILNHQYMVILLKTAVYFMMWKTNSLNQKFDYVDLSAPVFHRINNPEKLFIIFKFHSRT